MESTSMGFRLAPWKVNCEIHECSDGKWIMELYAEEYTQAFFLPSKADCEIRLEEWKQYGYPSDGWLKVN